ncbi:MAG TPA: hypothetical protein VD999_07460 [Vitreimonas sp.]|nr:hypothetical protein [Vitreimonas sp.]
MTFDLKPHHIQRPEKITWRFPYKGGDILSYLKSKTSRSFLRNADQDLLEFGITYQVKEVDENLFSQWLEYYSSKMSEQGYEVIANWEWYHKRKDEGYTIYLGLFTQGETWVGSEIFSQKDQRFIAAFKASERLEKFSKKRNSIGAVIDYFFIKYAVEHQAELISFGQSRNAFGVINTSGNLDYKLRFGFQPQPSKDTVLLTEVPIGEDGTVMFFGLQDGCLKLFGVKPIGSEHLFEQARFASDELPFVELTY